MHVQVLLNEIKLGKMRKKTEAVKLGVNQNDNIIGIQIAWSWQLEASTQISNWGKLLTKDFSLAVLLRLHIGEMRRFPGNLSFFRKVSFLCNLYLFQENALLHEQII